MPLSETNKSLHLEDDEDDEVMAQPRRLLELPCGTLIAYGGNEGTITAYKDGAFHVLHRYNDMIRAVAVSADGKRVVVGCDDGSTLVYPFDDYTITRGEAGARHPFCEALWHRKEHQDDDDDDNLLSQDFFSAGMKSFPGPQIELPIRDLMFVKEYVVAMASESGLVLVNVDSPSTLLERALEHDIQEHHSNSGIRGIARFHKYLATLAMDGRLCLWDTDAKTLVQREAVTCIPRKDVGEIHGADACDRSCRPVFCPLSSDTEAMLVTPGKLLPAVRWLSEGTLQEMELENTTPEKGHMEPIVAIHFLKPNENVRYFLTSGRDARVILWKWHDGNKVTPLETFVLSSPATDFLLQGSHLYAACTNGTYSTIHLAPHVPTSTLPLTKSVTKNAAVAAVAPAAASAAKNKKAKSKVVAAIPMKDDDDSDVDFGEPTSTVTTNRVRFVDDEAAEEEEDNDEKEMEAVPGKAGSDKDDDDSLEGRASSKKTPNDLVDDDDDVDDDMADENFGPYRASTTVLAPPSVPPQAAFSPSSTPLDLARRFLCWNHMGALTLLHGDDRNTVDITFTDSAYKRPISFTDNMNFIIGSLGEDGAIFATDLQLDDDEDGSLDGLDDLNMSEATKRAVRKSQKKGVGSKATGSTIFFYRFSSIGSLREKDWYLNLPVGERVWSTATGEGWAAVATSRKYIRFFSTGGNQGQMFWLKGDPVTMAGRGRFMAVVYHDSIPLADGTQQLAYQMWDGTTCEVFSEGPLSCLNKGASLTWLGFSNDMSLLAMDSDGMLSMLVQTGGNKWEWTPILDTMGLRKSMDDQFWPITVYDGKMVCVPLKGGNTHPDATRKPVTSTLGLRLPLATSSSGKT